MDPPAASLLLTPLQERAIAWWLITLAGLGVVWALAYRALRIPRNRDSGAMTYLEHAEEARRRILRAAFVLLFWFTFFLTFRLDPVPAGQYTLAYPQADIYGNAAAQSFQWVAMRTVPDGVTLIVSRSTEAIGAQMAVGFFLALFFSIPFVFIEIWGFFAPAMRPAERRVFLAALPSSVLLFMLGAAFAFAYVIPLLLDVLYRFADPLNAVEFVAASSLVGTVASLMAVFGLAFQLPLIMTGLSALGVVRPKTFLQKWRHATVLNLVIAALVTDPSLVSQLIVAACLIALYWLGVGAAFIFARTPSPATQQTY